MCQNSFHDPAPSTRAASLISGEMEPRPPRNISAMSGAHPHTFAEHHDDERRETGRQAS